MISAMQFNTFTNAAFNDVEEIDASLHVKWPITEWDNSSLDFDPVDVALDRGGTCNPPYVYAEIYNSGEDMTFSTWTWELYEVNNGKKEPISSVLESGEVPMINAEEIGKIETSNLQSLTDGTYRFKVNKPDRPGQEAIWSESITISGCARSIAPAPKAETETKAAETKEDTQPAMETESNSETRGANETPSDEPNAESTTQPAESTSQPVDKDTDSTKTSEIQENVDSQPKTEAETSVEKK